MAGIKSAIGRGLRKVTGRTAYSETDKLRLKYLEYYHNLPIDERAVLLEARNGKEVDGNIFYVLKKLLTDPAFSDYTLFVSAEEASLDTIVNKLSMISSNHEPVKTVIADTDYYFRALATCKYIVCDSTLKNYFIKRDEQIYLNLWHGTPFKVMGRKVAHEPHATGNAQKNFVAADYLLYPNEYMMNHMIEDYMIADISPAGILLEGYPRNTAFFDDSRRSEIIKEQQLEGKRIYVYMPTFRPELMGETLNDVLTEMDAAADVNEIVFAKVHPLAADDVDFSRFSNIRSFPGSYETYEFLNVADCLITDYSSVFYDFAVSGRKIVLYTYDEDEYLSTRGLYSPMDTLPFTRVKTIAEVFEAARTPKDYDDEAFLKEYCSFESPEATDIICSTVFMQKQVDLSVPANGRSNIMVFAGNLSAQRNIDTALDYLNTVNADEANYYLVFNRADVKDSFDFLLHLPAGIRYFGRAGRMAQPLNGSAYEDEDYRLEWHRCFDRMPVSEIVILNKDNTKLFQLMKWKSEDIRKQR